MNDLFEDGPEPAEPSASNSPEFSVSEISGAVKRLLEGEFGHVRVRGEIGRVSRPASGHLYYDLKDDRSVIAAVTWKGQAARLTVRPEEGMEVVATGRLTTFPGQSRYQLIIEDLAPAGAGALMAMLEKRKKALEAEGLFAASTKKKLPYLPEIIGVVTSPSGAVIRDILHRLRDRFPRKVLIWPVAVQGEKCAADVARAIAGFNRLTPGGALPRPDLIIVARGGGSIEDLWGFNEEIVVRAAAASAIPLISAVGHETDTTLIDHAADMRAPTPTAAAELAVPVRAELLAWTREQDARLRRAALQATAQRRQRLRDLSRALPRAEALLDSPRQRLDRAGIALPAALRTLTQRGRIRLSDLSGSLRPAILRGLVGTARRSLADRADRLRLDLLLARQRDRLADRAGRLRPAAITRDIARKRRDFDLLAQRMAQSGQRQTANWRGRIEALDRMRQTLGYTETLKRGYAVVRSGDRLLTTAATARAERLIEVEFADGRLAAVPAGPTAPASPPTGRAKPATGQPTLFDDSES